MTSTIPAPAAPAATEAPKTAATPAAPTPPKAAEAPKTPSPEAKKAEPVKAEATKAETKTDDAKKPLQLGDIDPAEAKGEVDLGDGRKEVLTPEQIKGMAGRYKDLNYRHQTEVAPLKKTLALLNQIRAQAEADGTPIDDEKMHEFLIASTQAYAKNPTMGGQTPPSSNANDDPTRTNTNVPTNTGTNVNNTMEDQLAQWEQENAVTLPPMYKDAINKTSNLENKLNELTATIQQITANGANVTKTAEEQLRSAQTQNAQTGVKQIMLNLQQVQQKYQLPNEAETDFMTFVQERGYMVEDLMDATLADKLGSDFKAVMQSPEMERLKAIHQRRQAFTGTAEPSPTNGGAAPPPAPSPDQSFIDTVATEHMQKRNMFQAG